MAQDKMTRAQLAQTIKDKYPEYKDVPNNQLVDKIIAKYPEYAETIGEAPSKEESALGTPTEQDEKNQGLTPTDSLSADGISPSNDWENSWDEIEAITGKKFGKDGKAEDEVVVEDAKTGTESLSTLDLPEEEVVEEEVPRAMLEQDFPAFIEKVPKHLQEDAKKVWREQGKEGVIDMLQSVEQNETLAEEALDGVNVPGANFGIFDLRDYKNMADGIKNVGTQVRNAWPNLRFTYSRLRRSVYGEDRTDATTGQDDDNFLDRASSRKQQQKDRDTIDILNAQMKSTSSFVDGVENGDVGEAVMAAVTAPLHLLSSVVNAAQTGTLSLYSDMFVPTYDAVNEAKAKRLGVTTQELLDKGEDSVAGPAAFTAGMTALEAFGLKGVGTAMVKVAGKKGLNKLGTYFLAASSEGVTEWGQTGLEKAAVEWDFSKDPIETAIALKDGMLSKEGLESFSIGFFAGGGATGIGDVKTMIADGRKNQKALDANIEKIAQLEEAASQSGVSPETLRNLKIAKEGLKLEGKALVEAPYRDLVNVKRPGIESLQTLNNKITKLHEKALAIESDKTLSQSEKDVAVVAIDNQINAHTNAALKVVKEANETSVKENEARIKAVQEKFKAKDDGVNVKDAVAKEEEKIAKETEARLADPIATVANNNAPGTFIEETEQNESGVNKKVFSNTTTKDGVTTTKFKNERSDKPGRAYNGTASPKVLEDYDIDPSEIDAGNKIVAVHEIRDGQRTTGATVTFENENGDTFQGEVVMTKKTKTKSKPLDTTVKVSKVQPEIDKVTSLPIEEEGGQTFNLDGSVYSKGGLAVPVASKNMKIGNISPATIQAFVNQHKDAIGDNSVKVGIYKFPNSDNASVDLNIVAPTSSRKAALEFGKIAGQESLFDLDTFENVKTGAKGNNPRNFTAEQTKAIAKALSEGKLPSFLANEQSQADATGKKVNFDSPKTQRVKEIVSRLAGTKEAITKYRAEIWRTVDPNSPRISKADLATFLTNAASVKKIQDALTEILSNLDDSVIDTKNPELMNLISNYTKMTGIPVVFKNLKANHRGYYNPAKNGKPRQLVLNKSFTSLKAFWHEAKHPYLAVLEKQRPALWKKIQDKINSEEDAEFYAKTLAELKKNPTYEYLLKDKALIDMEIAIRRMESTKAGTQWKNLWKEFVKVLQKAFGIKPKANPTWNDIATLIHAEIATGKTGFFDTVGGKKVGYSSTKADLDAADERSNKRLFEANPNRKLGALHSEDAAVEVTPEQELEDIHSREDYQALYKTTHKRLFQDTGKKSPKGWAKDVDFLGAFKKTIRQKENTQIRKEGQNAIASIKAPKLARAKSIKGLLNMENAISKLKEVQTILAAMTKAIAKGELLDHQRAILKNKMAIELLETNVKLDSLQALKRTKEMTDDQWKQAQKKRKGEVAFLENLKGLILTQDKRTGNYSGFGLLNMAEAFQTVLLRTQSRSDEIFQGGINQMVRDLGVKLSPSQKSDLRTKTRGQVDNLINLVSKLTPEERTAEVNAYRNLTGTEQYAYRADRDGSIKWEIQKIIWGHGKDNGLSKTSLKREAQELTQEQKDELSSTLYNREASKLKLKAVFPILNFLEKKGVITIKPMPTKGWAKATILDPNTIVIRSKAKFNALYEGAFAQPRPTKQNDIKRALSKPIKVEQNEKGKNVTTDQDLVHNQHRKDAKVQPEETQDYVQYHNDIAWADNPNVSNFIELLRGMKHSAYYYDTTATIGEDAAAKLDPSVLNSNEANEDLREREYISHKEDREGKVVYIDHFLENGGRIHKSAILNTMSGTPLGKARNYFSIKDNPGIKVLKEAGYRRLMIQAMKKYAPNGEDKMTDAQIYDVIVAGGWEAKFLEWAKNPAKHLGGDFTKAGKKMTLKQKEARTDVGILDADSVWSFIAVISEMKQAQEVGVDKFKSGLPIDADATNSIIQINAGLTMSKEAAVYGNLSDTQARQDGYKKVGEMTDDKMRADSESKGHKPESAPAKAQLRKIVKQLDKINKRFNAIDFKGLKDQAKKSVIGKEKSIVKEAREQFPEKYDETTKDDTVLNTVIDERYKDLISEERLSIQKDKNELFESEENQEALDLASNTAWLEENVVKDNRGSAKQPFMLFGYSASQGGIRDEIMAYGASQDIKKGNNTYSIAGRYEFAMKRAKYAMESINELVPSIKQVEGALKMLATIVSASKQPFRDKGFFNDFTLEIDSPKTFSESIKFLREGDVDVQSVFALDKFGQDAAKLQRTITAVFIHFLDAQIVAGMTQMAEMRGYPLSTNHDSFSTTADNYDQMISDFHIVMEDMFNWTEGLNVEGMSLDEILKVKATRGPAKGKSIIYNNPLMSLFENSLNRDDIQMTYDGKTKDVATADKALDFMRFQLEKGKETNGEAGLVFGNYQWAAEKNPHPLSSSDVNPGQSIDLTAKLQKDFDAQQDLANEMGIEDLTGNYVVDQNIIQHQVGKHQEEFMHEKAIEAKEALYAQLDEQSKGQAVLGEDGSIVGKPTQEGGRIKGNTLRIWETDSSAEDIRGLFSLLLGNKRGDTKAFDRLNVILKAIDETFDEALQLTSNQKGKTKKGFKTVMQKAGIKNKYYNETSGVVKDGTTNEHFTKGEAMYAYMFAKRIADQTIILESQGIVGKALENKVKAMTPDGLSQVDIDNLVKYTQSDSKLITVIEGAKNNAGQTTDPGLYRLTEGWMDPKENWDNSNFDVDLNRFYKNDQFSKNLTTTGWTAAKNQLWNDEVKSKIKATYTGVEPLIKNLDKVIQAMETNSTSIDGNQATAWLKSVNAWVTATPLGFNTWAGARQLTSFINFADGNLLALPQFFGNIFKHLPMMKEVAHLDWVRDRFTGGGTLDIDFKIFDSPTELSSSDVINWLKSARRKAVGAGFAPIVLGDIGAILLGGTQYYARIKAEHIANGKTEAEAKKLAETALRKKSEISQQSKQANRLSAQQLDHTWSLALTFTSTHQQAARIKRAEMIALKRNWSRMSPKERSNGIAKATYYALLQPFLWEVATSLFPNPFGDEDDEEEYGKIGKNLLRFNMTGMGIKGKAMVALWAAAESGKKILEGEYSRVNPLDKFFGTLVSAWSIGTGRVEQIAKAQRLAVKTGSFEDKLRVWAYGGDAAGLSGKNLYDHIYFAQKHMNTTNRTFGQNFALMFGIKPWKIDVADDTYKPLYKKKSKKSRTATRGRKSSNRSNRNNKR